MFQRTENVAFKTEKGLIHQMFTILPQHWDTCKRHVTKDQSELKKQMQKYPWMLNSWLASWTLLVLVTSV